MTGTIIVLLICVALLTGGFIAFTLVVINRLKSLKNNIEKADANIDVLLKQRFDEIPQLVDVCKAYMSYETKVLTDLVTLSKKFESLKTENLNEETTDEALNLDSKLNQSMSGLSSFAAEQYPQLLAAPQFIQIQERISDIETRISYRREFYNDSINLYNIQIESLPDALVARIMGYNKKDFLKVSEEEKEIPKSF